MANMLKKLRGNTRRFVQWCALLLSNGYAAGFINTRIYTGPTKRVCIPGLNCYSCPGAIGACPIGALQAVMGSHKFSFSYYVAGLLIFFGAVFGRFICGWLCPFGLIQELLHRIPLPKAVKRFRRKSLPGHKALKWLKYFILAWFVILAPLFIVDMVGQGAPWFCKYICPAGTLEGGWTLVLLDGALRSAIGFLYAWKSTLLIILIALSIFVYRPFCKYLCPLGAIYSVFNPISLVRFKFDRSKCIDCNMCARACPMSIDVKANCNSLECIRCGRCIKVCKSGAISYANRLPQRKSFKAKSAADTK